MEVKLDQDNSTASDGVETEDVAEETSEATEDEIVAETDQEDLEAEASEGEDGEGEEPEEIEFDFGGNKFRVPKNDIPEELAVKVDDFVRNTWTSFTKKSQSVAEQTKRLEARESAVEKISGMQGAVLESYANGTRLQQEIAELQKIDLAPLWQSPNQEDRDYARQVSDAINTKTAEFNSTVAQVSANERQLENVRREEVARRMEEGRSIVEASVPGFAEQAPEVIRYAVETYGVSQEAAEQWPLDPISAQMAYKAMLWDRMQVKASKAKPKAKAAKPVRSIRGKGAVPRQDPDKMTPEQWRDWRNADLAKRRAS